MFDFFSSITKEEKFLIDSVKTLLKQHDVSLGSSHESGNRDEVFETSFYLNPYIGIILKYTYVWYQPNKYHLNFTIELKINENPGANSYSESMPFVVGVSAYTAFYNELEPIFIKKVNHKYNKYFKVRSKSKKTESLFDKTNTTNFDKKAIDYLESYVQDKLKAKVLMEVL